MVGIAAQALGGDAGLALEHQVAARPAAAAGPRRSAARRRRPGGRRTSCRPACPARPPRGSSCRPRYHQVGARDQAVAVDRVLGHDHRRQRSARMRSRLGGVRGSTTARTSSRRPRSLQHARRTAGSRTGGRARRRRAAAARRRCGCRPGPARAAPPGRARSRPGSTPPSAPDSARAAAAARRSGAARSGGIASGTSTREARRQLSECCSVANS